MTSEHYVIRGGLEGRERLRVLARLMWPTTESLLSEVGVAPSASCLDVGCGGGDVSVALARMAPEGLVLGIDLDATKVQLAEAEATEDVVRNVSFLQVDVLEDPLPDEWRDTFDLVYARFLLTHLPDPAAALARLVPLLRPGAAM